MEETQTTPVSGGDDTNGCVNCGSSAVVEGYPTKLCAGCRKLFIEYPIPLGIKIFGASVIVVLLFSLFTFPKHLSLGLHLEKGKQYEKKHQFKAAQQEFETVLQKVPDNVEAKAHLMIAAFYNLDFITFAEKGQQLAGVDLEDENLLNRLNSLADKMGGYLPDDSLEKWMDKYPHWESIPDSAFHRYLTDDSRNVYGMLSYAGNLFGKGKWVKVDSLAEKVLSIDSENSIALRLLANSKKEQGSLDESIKFCDRMLGINNELGFAYAIKARTLLKQKKDVMALELARRSVDLDREDPYSNATLALAYHFNNMPAKRDALIQQVKASRDSSMISYLQYAIDVIEHKEKFRN